MVAVRSMLMQVLQQRLALSPWVLLVLAAACLCVPQARGQVDPFVPSPLPPVPLFPVPALTPNYWNPPLSNAPVGIATAEVVSPPQLAGVFTWSPAPWSGRNFVNESCTGVHEAAGTCRVHVRLTLLHPDDDYVFTYQPSSPCQLVNGTDPAGQPFDEHSLLMSMTRLPGTGCTYGAKALAVNNIGVAGLMNFACDEAVHNCPEGLATIYALQDLNNIVIPYASHPDGMKFRDYLTNHYYYRLNGVNPVGVVGDFSEELWVSFPATGRMVASERAALVSIVQNLEVKTADYDEWQSNSALQSWYTVLTNPSADPCIDRIMGMTCEDGHLVSLWLFGYGYPAFNGPLHPAWGSFSRLRTWFSPLQNLYGPMPDSFCNLTSLQVLDLNSQADKVRTDVKQGITSLPDCLGLLPNLVWISVGTNLVSNFPSTFNASLTPGAEGKLMSLQMESNLLTSLPADFSTRLAGLSQLWLNDNPFAVPFPSFKNWPNLADWWFPKSSRRRGLIIDHANFLGPMPDDAFDGTRMDAIDISFNRITGPLPALRVQADSTKRIDFSYNQFSGDVPATWSALTSVLQVNLAHNDLIGPARTLSLMTQVTDLDVSYNRIRNRPQEPNDFAVTLGSMLSSNIVNVNAAHNNISGIWQGGALFRSSLRKLNIAYNHLLALPDDLFQIPVTSLDVSFNGMRGVIPAGSPDNLVTFDLTGNPELEVWPLPAWLVPREGAYYTEPGSSYSCSVLENPNKAAFQFTVTAASLLYNGCNCVTGKFGLPPLCGSVPEMARISPVSGFSSTEVGEGFSGMVDGGAAGNPDIVTKNATLLSPDGFTDDWYGTSQRLTNGVSTTFVIDAQDLFYDTTGLNGVASSTARRLMGFARRSLLAEELGPVPVGEQAPGVVQLKDGTGSVYRESSSMSGPNARFQPVRMIRIQLHLSRAEFNIASDNINVFEGDLSQSGDGRVASIVGTDTFSDPPPYPPAPGTPHSALHITQTDAYWARYGAQLNALVNRTLIEVVVLSNSASVQFLSRAQGGRHFFATYTYSFMCEPAGEYFLDPVSQKCRSDDRVLINGDDLIAMLDPLYSIVAAIVCVLGAWATNLILQVAVKARSSASARADQPAHTKTAAKGTWAKLRQLPVVETLSAAVTTALCTIWGMQVLVFATLQLEADKSQHVTGDVEPEFQVGYIIGALPVLLGFTLLAVTALLFPFGLHRKLRRTIGHMSRVDASRTQGSTGSISGDDEWSASGSGAGEAGEQAQGGASLDDSMLGKIKAIPIHVLSFIAVCAALWSLANLVCHVMLASSLNTWGHVAYHVNAGSLVWCFVVSWVLLVFSLVAFIYLNYLFVSAVLSAGATLVFFFATITTSSFTFVQLAQNLQGELLPGTNSKLDDDPLILSKLVLILLVLLPSCAITFILVALQTVKLRLTWDVLAKRLSAEQKNAAILARNLNTARCAAAADAARANVLASELAMTQHIRTVLAHMKNSSVDPQAEKRELTLWLQSQIIDFLATRARRQARAARLAMKAQAAKKARLAPVGASGSVAEPSSDGSHVGSELGSHNDVPAAGSGAAYAVADSVKQLQRPRGSTGTAPRPAAAAGLVVGIPEADGLSPEDRDLPGSVVDDDEEEEEEENDDGTAHAHRQDPVAPVSLIDRVNAAAVANKAPFYLTDMVGAAYVAQAAAHNFSSENSFFLSCDFFYARFCRLAPAKGSGMASAFAAERARVARLLYDMFAAEGAPHQINMAGTARAALEKELASIGSKSAKEAAHLFDPVRQVVTDLIQTNLLTNLATWDTHLIKAMQQQQQQQGGGTAGATGNAEGRGGEGGSKRAGSTNASPLSPASPSVKVRTVSYAGASPVVGLTSSTQPGM